MSQVCDLEETEHRTGWPPRSRPSTPTTGSRRGRTGIPEPFVDGYCRLARRSTTRRRWATSTWEPEVWSAERVTGRDDRFLTTGRRQFGVLAYAADGTCVVAPRLFVNEVAAWRALQGGTLVLPEHRGHRLGMAVKIANQMAVRAAFPECRYVFTSNAGVNAPMNAVNDVLGFRDASEALEMQFRL